MPEGVNGLEVDARPIALLRQYLELVGGQCRLRSPSLAAVTIPSSEHHHFDDRTISLIAFSVDGLEESPEAEILVNGSELLRQLIGAIRSRGGELEVGALAPSVSGSPSDAPPLPLVDATSQSATASTTYRRVGRLLAKLSVQAGPALEERLVETPVVDLLTGRQVSVPVASAISNPDSILPPSRDLVAANRPASEFLPLLLSHLEEEARSDLERLRAEAARELGGEVTRLEGYYAKMIAEEEPDEESNDLRSRRAAIRADRARRVKEEESRFAVKVTVHPIQLTTWLVPSQEVTWSLQGVGGAAGLISAARALIADEPWSLTCPACGESPQHLTVCRHSHVACDACASRCTICGDRCCAIHGSAECAVEGHFVCDVHGETCSSCDGTHCPSHAARCDRGDHDVCTNCAVTCAVCGEGVCLAHSTLTAEVAPKGVRRVCPNCVVFCEGGQNEPVGTDEVARCVACDRYICGTHQSVCSVDGALHCSKHLRKSDRSGRLVCESHRVACADEPRSVMASDEVQSCASCGRSICDRHGATCEVDGHRHCNGHLSELRDMPGALACATHRSTCAVDLLSFSLGGTASCPVCDSSVCGSHQRRCKNCARAVCIKDISDERCLTCARLTASVDPEDAILRAVTAVNGGEPIMGGSWRVSRDANHTVAEVGTGWSRRLVVTVRHGEFKPATAVRHSLLGSRRIR